MKLQFLILKETKELSFTQCCVKKILINILKEKSLASFSHILFYLFELSNKDVFICK